MNRTIVQFGNPVPKYHSSLLIHTHTYNPSRTYAGLSRPSASWCLLAFSLRSAMLLLLERLEAAAAAASEAANPRECECAEAVVAAAAAAALVGVGWGRQKRPPAAA